jgi:radical SAM superfamily enzyme YgiQ (UPF0313 family)
MRVLLISANLEKLPDPVAPIGMACLASALQSSGNDVQCLDLCFEENIEDALKKVFLDFSPEAIGLALRNLDNVAYPETVSYLPFYKDLVKSCRRYSSAPVILGGSGFTLMPEAILNYVGADGGVIGEGEEAFSEILRKKAAAHDYSGSSILGFIRLPSGNPQRAARVEDLNALPSPDWSSLPLEKYFQQGGMGNLQTKRGCPFHCLYCTYPLIEGAEIRLRSPAKVATEAETLVRRGVQHAFIVDNIFNYPEDHAQEVCRIFIQKKISLQWSCYGYPGQFSRALAEEMQAAGCTGVEFGTDSGSIPVLARLRKSFTPEDIDRATRAAREAGLEVCHSLSLGSPGETPETLQETLQLMEEIAPTAVIAMVGLRVFPGTGLALLAREEGIVSRFHDFLTPTFYIAPSVRGMVLDFCRKAAMAHPNWIFPGMGINISPRLQAKLRRIGVKGPLWEHMKVMRQRQAFPEGTHA